MTLEVVDSHIHEAVVDFDAFDPDAVSDAAGRIHDGQCRVAETVWDVARNELPAAFRKDHVINDCRRHRDGQKDQERSGEEEQASHRGYSFGEKLICRRGPAFLDSGSAMSIPNVTTGRRTR